MNTLDLNGRWLIRHDPFNAGLLWGWSSRPPEEGWREITVPSAWQSALGAEANGIAWYQRRIPAEVQGWLVDARSRVRLRFESVATDCRAWVNGVEVGRHLGDFVPFEFDITGALSGGDGSGQVVVRVDQVHAPRPVKGTVTENGHITKGFHDVLSLQHAGIWGGVSLRRTAALHIAPNGASVRTDPTTRRVRIEVEFEGDAACEAVSFTIYSPGGERSGGGTVELRPGQRHLVEEVELNGPISIWSPQTPNLYTLRLEVAPGPGVLPVVEEHTLRFGFRTIATGGPGNSHILLNATPICLRGILHWGHEPAHIAPAPPPDQVREEFGRLRDLGFNCVCLCMVYMPEHFYDIADETGMLIWQEHPVWKSPMGDEQIPEYKRMFESFFRRDRRHPSVILVSGSCEHEAFNKTLAAWWWQRAHEMLPDRLLQLQTAFFNWTDPDQTDLYDEHVYDNSGRWVKFLEDVRGTINGLKPKPFIMGETIISNAWPDVDSYRARLRADHPWWTTRGLKECADFEAWITDRYGAPTLARFRRQADRFGKQYRKFQAEVFRTYPHHAGWVMNHIRDVPQGRCGFKDDFGNWRYTPAETLPWLGETALILVAPAWFRSFTGGRSASFAIHVSTCSAGVSSDNVVVTAGANGEDHVEHRLAAEQSAGAVAAVSFELDLPAVTRPTAITVRASGANAAPNQWTIWSLPPCGPVSQSVGRMTGLPFTAAEREPEFEERAYSAGWGLPCRSWTPSLPDTALLLPDAATWEHNAPLAGDTRVIVTHRLTSRAADFARSGGRVLLLASRHAGGFGSKFVNHYGQVPLVLERDGDSWPVGAGESDWIVDLLHYDLSLGGARAIPVQELGIDGVVDPIIRLVFTHDGGVPRPFDAVFAARVGKGLLVVTCLDHSTEAGRYLLERVLRYVQDARTLPAEELDVSRWVV